MWAIWSRSTHLFNMQTVSRNAVFISICLIIKCRRCTISLKRGLVWMDKGWAWNKQIVKCVGTMEIVGCFFKNMSCYVYTDPLYCPTHFWWVFYCSSILEVAVSARGIDWHKFHLFHVFRVSLTIEMHEANS